MILTNKTLIHKISLIILIFGMFSLYSADTSEAITGDVDGSQHVDLTDAIQALKIIAGIAPDEVNIYADIDGDDKIGLHEAIFALQITAKIKELRTGYFTGKPLNSTKEIAAAMLILRESLKPQFEDNWFIMYDTYVGGYRNKDGNPNSLEALFGVMFASVLHDNVYPFGIAVSDALQIEPESPFILNCAVVALLRLGNLELAGKLLDLAYEIDPIFFITFLNAASWYDAMGMTDEAIEAMKKAAELEPENEFLLWNGGEYARSKNRDEDANYFFSRLSSNYPLKNNDGSSGGNSSPKVVSCIYCNCNDTAYDDLDKCLSECKVSLGCFTGICYPVSEECCDKCCDEDDKGDSPFSVSVQVCFPPVGVQACISGDTKGNVSIAVQGGLGDLVQVGIKGTLSFSGGGVKTGVSIYGGVSSPTGAGFGFEYDPVSGNIAPSFSGSAKVSTGVLSVGINLPTLQQLELMLKCP